MAKIDKNDLTREQIEKAIACKTADELIKLAKTEGYELTQEEAEAYLAELADVELDEETLKKAAGGDSCYFVQCPAKCLDGPDFKPPAV